MAFQVNLFANSQESLAYFSCSASSTCLTLPNRDRSSHVALLCALLGTFVLRSKPVASLRGSSTSGMRTLCVCILRRQLRALGRFCTSTAVADVRKPESVFEAAASRQTVATRQVSFQSTFSSTANRGSALLRRSEIVDVGASWIQGNVTDLSTPPADAVTPKLGTLQGCPGEGGRRSVALVWGQSNTSITSD